MATSAGQVRTKMETARPLYPAMRRLLIAFGVLTALATNQLYVLSGHTDRFFAWTITPTLSATFLGAGYAAGCLLVLTTLPAQTWDRARLPVVTVFLFTLLTLGATLLSASRFHFSSRGAIARFAAWFWLAVYIVVPLWMLCLVGAQRRIPREQRPTTAVAPSRPLRAALRIEAGARQLSGVCCISGPACRTRCGRGTWPRSRPAPRRHGSSPSRWPPTWPASSAISSA